MGGRRWGLCRARVPVVWRSTRAITLPAFSTTSCFFAVILACFTAIPMSAPWRVPLGRLSTYTYTYRAHQARFARLVVYVRLALTSSRFPAPSSANLRYGLLCPRCVSRLKTIPTERGQGARWQGVCRRGSATSTENCERRQGSRSACNPPENNPVHRSPLHQSLFVYLKASVAYIRSSLYDHGAFDFEHDLVADHAPCSS